MRKDYSMKIASLLFLIVTLCVVGEAWAEPYCLRCYEKGRIVGCTPIPCPEEKPKEENFQMRLIKMDIQDMIFLPRTVTKNIIQYAYNAGSDFKPNGIDDYFDDKWHEATVTDGKFYIDGEEVKKIKTLMFWFKNGRTPTYNLSTVVDGKSKEEKPTLPEKQDCEKYSFADKKGAFVAPYVNCRVLNQIIEYLKAKEGGIDGD